MSLESLYFQAQKQHQLCSDAQRYQSCQIMFKPPASQVRTRRQTQSDGQQPKLSRRHPPHGPAHSPIWSSCISSVGQTLSTDRWQGFPPSGPGSCTLVLSAKRAFSSFRVYQEGTNGNRDVGERAKEQREMEYILVTFPFG